MAYANTRTSTIYAWGTIIRRFATKCLWRPHFREAWLKGEVLFKPWKRRLAEWHSLSSISSSLTGGNPSSFEQYLKWSPVRKLSDPLRAKIALFPANCNFSPPFPVSFVKARLYMKILHHFLWNQTSKPSLPLIIMDFVAWRQSEYGTEMRNMVVSWWTSRMAEW